MDIDFDEWLYGFAAGIADATDGMVPAERIAVGVVTLFDCDEAYGCAICGAAHHDRTGISAFLDFPAVVLWHPCDGCVPLLNDPEVEGLMDARLMGWVDGSSLAPGAYVKILAAPARLGSRCSHRAGRFVWPRWW